MSTTPGQRFRDAVAQEHPLQVVGAINANHALLAKRAGFKAIYLSGGGVAAGSLGLPDLGITGLDAASLTRYLIQARGDGATLDQCMRGVQRVAPEVVFCHGIVRL